ncbi:hypothetical protein AZH53_05960 [Methanomicrobiaceae archaeon CYW5]|uniref:hypothetical protein n=1 Tax=Methanovulcanius yangii TaxID=1789227 RepID=UPI0029C9C621|nr:hypothetical protein [Methanovulcanius yangii]MBT8507953.1 hypothetical protein [Methanovulcanius yangii]
MALFLIVCPVCTARDSPDESQWELTLIGDRTITLTGEEFISASTTSGATFTDTSGDVYGGLPLTYLIGLVDDGDDPSYNSSLPAKGYTVIIRATDWHDRSFSAGDITQNGFLVADTCNGLPLPAKDGDIKIAPLLLIGPDVSADMRIGNIMDITLAGPAITGVPEDTTCVVTILRRETDGGPILNMTEIGCSWMEEHLPIHGDTVTPYRFQGPTFDTTDLWNPAENKNLAKVEEIVRGTALCDLCDLVGGMEEGDELRMTATDGYVVELMYGNIYGPHPAQGLPILAWWTQKQGYVPAYTGGPALFFLADDQTFGNQDMMDYTDEAYWRFYWCEGTEYPSAAGLAIRNVATMEIYPRDTNEWELALDGYLTTAISRKEFEQGLACGERASGHLVSYTDTDGHVWTGMPLYMLAGWVDDDIQHDENLVNNRAYNTTLAQTNAYAIVVEGDAGEQASFTAAETMKSHAYILANAVDGDPFTPGDRNWPLTIVGENVSPERTVHRVTGITLDFSGHMEEAADMGAPATPVPLFGVGAGLALACILRGRH